MYQIASSVRAVLSLFESMSGAFDICLRSLGGDLENTTTNNWKRYLWGSNINEKTKHMQQRYLQSRPFGGIRYPRGFTINEQPLFLLFICLLDVESLDMMLNKSMSDLKQLSHWVQEELQNKKYINNNKQCWKQVRICLWLGANLAELVSRILVLY